MTINKEIINSGSCNIEFDHNLNYKIETDKDFSFEVNSKLLDSENNVIIEDFACINYFDLKDTTDSRDELKIVNVQLKNALSYFIEGYYKQESTYDILCNSTYCLDLFGVETYNGWDIDEQQEVLNCDKDKAIISILLYCIIKIHFALKIK
jgi:hypothetical protein